MRSFIFVAALVCVALSALPAVAQYQANQGAAPALWGETNGTIGPPGLPVTSGGSASSPSPAMPSPLPTVPVLQGATPTIPLDDPKPTAPVLQGASCGTIGPVPAYQLETVTLKPESRIARVRSSLPFVSQALLFGVAVSICFWVIQTLRAKKNAAFWILGGLAAVILFVAGLAWGSQWT